MLRCLVSLILWFLTLVLALHCEYFIKGHWAVRDWGQEEKGTTQDETAGWQHWVDGRESEWTPGAGDGQGGLARCDSWGLKESDRLSDWTELNWTDGVCIFLLVLYSSSKFTQKWIRIYAFISYTTFKAHVSFRFIYPFYNYSLVSLFSVVIQVTGEALEMQHRLR